MSLSLCGILERLAAVGFVALVGRAPLGGVLSAFAVLAWRLGALPGASAELAWRLLLVSDVCVGCSVGCDLLLGEVVRCSCDLLVPPGAMRVAASAALLRAPRTIAVVHITVPSRTRLDSISVILDEVMDVIVQVLVSLPGATSIAVLLIQCPVSA